MCAQNPDFTKDDKVQELYESHYSRDLAFIEQEVRKRDHANIFLAELKDIDDYVREEKRKNLSLLDYAYIGTMWVSVLSSSEPHIGDFKETLKKWKSLNEECRTKGSFLS
jgi:hypothetical protein